MNIIIVDYPETSYEIIISDNPIFIFGRSLGISPDIYLSSKMETKSLFLVSAIISFMKL